MQDPSKKKQEIILLYQHTQPGYVIIATLLFVILLRWIIFSQVGVFSRALISFMLAILILLSSFTSLTVTIDENFLRIKFGWGIFCKRFALDQIVSAKAVKNKRYYGRGIRGRFRPCMWIFNVSGFEAVELLMANGKIYRIGTDQPEQLQKAFSEAVRSRESSK